MPQINKPSSLNQIWSAGGDIATPSASKISIGWEVEVPPRQWFNWLDNRQDQAIAHINQHGIAVWDNLTEYQGGKSYVQGSDGIIYKAITTNREIDPVGNPTTWQVAFVGADQVPVATTSSVIHANGLVMQWVSNTGIVGSAVGAATNISVNFPVPLSSVLSIQLTHANGNSAESAEMSYSVDSNTNSTATAKFLRVSGSNTGGSETVKANFFIIGML